MYFAQAKSRSHPSACRLCFYLSLFSANDAQGNRTEHFYLKCSVSGIRKHLHLPEVLRCTNVVVGRYNSTAEHSESSNYHLINNYLLIDQRLNYARRIDGMCILWRASLS